MIVKQMILVSTLGNVLRTVLRINVHRSSPHTNLAFTCLCVTLLSCLVIVPFMDLSFIVSIFQRIIQESSPVTYQIISCLNSSCRVENSSCWEFKPFADLSCLCVFFKVFEAYGCEGEWHISITIPVGWRHLL